MESQESIARRLATGILRGRVERDSVIKRGREVFGRHWPWIQSFARRLVAHFGAGRRPRQFLVERFILGDAGFQRAWRKDSLILSDFKCRSPLMCPASGPPRKWKVPSLRTTGDPRAGSTFNRTSWLGLPIAGRRSRNCPRGRCVISGINGRPNAMGARD